jgi:RNA polymerase sigma-70 factor (ECF subfamily)
MGESITPDTGDLLNLIEAGDLRARSVLFDRHRARLMKMVAVRFDQRLARRLDPSDVVQETLAEAAASLSDYARERPIAFYPWLRQLAGKVLLRLYERHVLAHRRSVNREVVSMPALSGRSADRLARRLSGPRSSPADRLIAAELRARLRAALLELSEQDREILVLRHLEELSNAEIAEFLGIRVDAVRARHTRALDRLRRQVEGSSADSG